MSDIDFEELDQAVSNIMSNVDTTKRNSSLDDPEDIVVTLGDDTLEVQSPPESAVTEPQTSAELAVEAPVVAAAVAAPALAMKRRGQFMDVMHPSSDMKTTKLVKREGLAIVAAPNDVAPVAPTVAAVSPTPIVEELPVPEESEYDSSTQESPLVSPFLPDTKPEKRPLGGATDTAAAREAAVGTELPGELTTDPSVLPEELTTDIMAIESTVSTAIEPITVPEAVEPVEPQPVKNDASAEQVAEVSDEPIAVPAGGSIAQQYSEAPSSGDQTNGSIYDTTNYHQPIESAAPVKKKSSVVKWILISIGLLLLGAGGGVVYFLLNH